MEQTFFLVKPEAFKKQVAGEIINDIQAKGFTIKKLDKIFPVPATVEFHYRHLKEKEFFPELVKNMTSGSIFIGILEGENIIAKFRKFIGPTNPNEAPKNTIRGKYGYTQNNEIFNMIHGSDSQKAAEEEIKNWFK